MSAAGNIQEEDNISLHSEVLKINLKCNTDKLSKGHSNQLKETPGQRFKSIKQKGRSGSTA